MSGFDTFLVNKLSDIKLSFSSNKEILYTDFYEELPQESLKDILVILHCHFNELFKHMNSKGANGHYNAHESRQLIKLIDFYKVLKATAKKYAVVITINAKYEELIKKCNSFLVPNKGSTIPDDFEPILLVEDEAIFKIESEIMLQTTISTKPINLKLIGGGSYANVYKFKEPNFGITLVQKKALKTLTKEELERFKYEFEDLASLDSPFIIKVYDYDNTEPSYTMEYIDNTLDEFISKNNTKLTYNIRKYLIVQLLTAFKYIHSKKMLHRDISFKNILIKTYEDGTNILKVADLGLVKHEERALTRTDTEIKGSINDYSDLQRVGFKNYSIVHETYALTKIIYFILTGKKSNYHKEKNKSLSDFINKGISADLSERFQSVNEMRNYLNTHVYPSIRESSEVHV